MFSPLRTIFTSGTSSSDSMGFIEVALLATGILGLRVCCIGQLLLALDALTGLVGLPLDALQLSAVGVGV